MKSLYLIFSLIVVLAYGCEKDIVNNVTSVYTGYPTAYYRMDSDDLKLLESDYFNLNPHINSGLDEFGFCGLDESDLNRNIEFPPDPQLSRSQCIGVVHDFLSQNSRYTGVTDPDQMNFINVDSSFGVWDGSLFWSLRSTNQFIKGIEVYYSSIIFHLWHGKMKYCSGNWYPEIYIPESFTIDSTEAKKQLIGRVVTHFGWSGPFKRTISGSDIAMSSVKTVILPVRNDDVIVLYVTWEINVPAPVYYKFYIDVMSGYTISEVPTILF